MYSGSSNHGFLALIPPVSVNPLVISANPDPLDRGCSSIDPLFPLDQGSTLRIQKIGNHPVACGGYSDVWKAEMMVNGKVTSIVALKVLRPMGSDRDREHKRLVQEVSCWKDLRHDNVAPFYGVQYQSNGSPAIVLPWYENGSADIYLGRHPDVNPMQLIREIAAGVEYLHEKCIVHGDLKGANVMVDDAGHARLIDFGLSRLTESEAGLTTSNVSSIRWCAPELLNATAHMSKSSDVYAFGSTALELLTGDVPYSKLINRFVLSAVIRGETPRGSSRSLRYNIPRSEDLWALMEQCWKEAALRPSIREVRLRLRDL